MSKILIIPDVHGRIFWKYAISNIDNYSKVIFLGDYLDPYPNEKISKETAISNFKDIIEFKKNNEDKVILLLGNHDSHYYYLDFMDCSRLDYNNRLYINDIFDKNKDYFNFVYVINDIVFSHAGIYKEWIKDNSLILEDILKNIINPKSLQRVSWIRGGCDEVGSCIWADIRESLGHKLIDGYYQIVGHTQLSENPYITDKIACLDVRKCFELDTDTKKIIPININSENNENTNNK